MQWNTGTPNSSEEFFAYDEYGCKYVCYYDFQDAHWYDALDNVIVSNICRWLEE